HFAKRWLREADIFCASERIEDVGYGFARLIVAHQTNRESLARAGVMHKHGRNLAEFVFVLLYVFAGTIKTLLFAGEKNKANRALGLHAGLHKGACGF